MSLLITICARGGSKGVPNKNIRGLLGIPLIAYTINTAKKWGKATHLMVSTDSDEIADCAVAYGADVFFRRPYELAQDTAPKIPVLRHALQESERHYRQKFDCVMDLDVTALLRTPEDLENCWRKFQADSPTVLFSVVKAHKNPYFNMVEQGPDGVFRLCKPIPESVTRRQDVPPVYEMNASIYLYKRDFLLDPNTTMPYSSDFMIYEMNPLAGFDIDREIDFKIIELILKENLFAHEFVQSK